MYVVMIASECAPVAKVGGLADVVFGLCRELQLRGHSVEVVLPKYDCMRYDQIWGLQATYENLWVPWDGGRIRCTVWFGFVHGLKCFFIEPHSFQHFFNRGAYYGFSDEAQRFAFFSRAALEFMWVTGKKPDVIHTHDWQTALVPVLLYEIYAGLGMGDQRVCHTIHNFRHQGVVGPDLLWASGLGRPEYYGARDRMGDAQDPNAINFTKGALLYANFVTTVSPHHAWEARHTDQGCGLGHPLHEQQRKFGGIINGIDYAMWNPEIDPLIPVPFNADTLAAKEGNTQALRERLLLRDAGRPILAYVGRLDPQKGLHLIRHTLFWALANDAQFVLLGSGSERAIDADFRHLKQELNDNPDCHLEIGFDENLAHLIYAGADFVVMPSLWEPCGLAQMIALRYGTVPIVRACGGLADTVFDWDHSLLPQSQRNGFVFEHADHEGIESALRRALGLWREAPALFRELQAQGMRCDYSWRLPAQSYLDVYDFIRHR
ncbi:MAG: glycogen synthase [Betaproteobacteria bacterium]|nr:glycogen synthase [Betaproteobacteria bacterium]